MSIIERSVAVGRHHHGGVSNADNGGAGLLGIGGTLRRIGCSISGNNEPLSGNYGDGGRILHELGRPRGDADRLHW